MSEEILSEEEESEGESEGETEEESEGESEGETEEESDDETEEESDDDELSPEELKSLAAKLGNITIAKPIVSNKEEDVAQEKIPILNSTKNLTLPPLTVPPPSTSITENLKPKKEIVIQPASKEEVEASLSPKPGKKVGRPKKISITTETVKEKRKKIKAPPLETLLVKESVETNEFFAMRSAYSQMAAKVFPKEESTTHLLLGYYGANRGKYGLTYPEQTEKVLEYIDQIILLE